MKLLGYSRKVDELGRIVIPIEIRKKLNINILTYVDFYLNDDNSIMIKQSKNVCSFCGSTKDLKEFNDKYICKSCLDRLKNV